MNFLVSNVSRQLISKEKNYTTTKHEGLRMVFVQTLLTFKQFSFPILYWLVIFQLSLQKSLGTFNHLLEDLQPFCF